MADIKTRDVVKGTVKTLDRSAVATERMKSATVRTKDAAEQSVNGNEVSAQEYGANRVESAVEIATAEGVHQFNKRGKNGIRDAKRNVEKVKENYNKLKDLKKTNKPKKAASKTAKAAKNTTQQTAKTVKATGKGTVKTAQAAGKGTVKTAQNTVKTAKATGKVAVKTAQTTAKAAKVTAQATAKAAKAAAATAKAAVKATIVAIKVAVKAIVAAVKLAIAAVKAIAAAIAAGGWVAVVVIIVICLIALIVGSCFGIFFSSEDTGSGQSMQTVVQEINTEYQTQIETTKNNITYDVLEMSGSRAVWAEVLSVYAVKTTTDPDNAQEVATMDASKKAILKDIFWQMNAISSRTETKTETVITETDDGHGNIVQTETTVTRTYLYITVTHKTADEMATQFGFNADQKKQLNELLSEDNKSLWAAVLYGISTSDTQIVSVALSQIGEVGGQPYWSWYGFGSRVEWCACFVSWCANECGYIDDGIIPKYAGCVNGVDWFKDRGQWFSRAGGRYDYLLRLGLSRWYVGSAGRTFRPYGHRSKGRERKGLYRGRQFR